MWGELIQNGGKGVIRRGKRGIEKSVSSRDRKGKDDTVGPVGPAENGFGGETGNRFLGLAQGVGVDGVAVFCEQLSQLGLPQVAAHHPDVQFVFHRQYLQNRPYEAGGGFNPLYGEAWAKVQSGMLGQSEKRLNGFAGLRSTGQIEGGSVCCCS